MRRCTPLILLTIFALAGLPAFSEQTLETVEKEVDALWSKINSFTANITTDAAVPMGPLEMKTRAAGTVECLKQGDKSLFRLDIINKISGLPVGGEQKVLSVFDGQHVYSQVDMMGMTQAVKMVPDGKNQGPAAGGSMFAAFREQGEVKLLPDGTVNGKPVYIVEITPNEDVKASAPMAISKMRAYISKELGLQLKMEVLGENGEPMSTTVYDNIAINVALSPERFVYTAPEGVKVQEKTPKEMMKKPF